MKLTKHLTFVLLFLLICGSDAIAQQDAQYTQYMFNGLAINPAYAGSRDGLSTTLLVRKQWVGIEGSPTTASLSFHGLSGNERHGFGGYVVNDNLGITNMLNVHGTYAFIIPLDDVTNLSFGIQGGLQSYANDWGKIRTIDEDFAFPDGKQNLFLPTAGAGVYFSTDRYYIGASVPNLIPNKYNREQFSVDPAKQVVHVFATAGVVFDLGESLKMRPTTLFKYAVGAPIEFDVNLSFLIKDMFWVGASYRTGDAINFLAEFVHHKGFRVGYAYDFTLTRLRQVTSGSHELMLGYDIPRSKKKIKTPRYF